MALVRSLLAGVVLSFGIGAAQAEPVLTMRFSDEVLKVEKVTDVRVERDPSTWLNVIYFALTKTDATKFGKLTANHIGKTMKLDVCGETLSEPRIMAALYGRSLQATGLEDALAEKVEMQLKSGSCS